MEPVVLIICFFVGAILGSFACCSAWRIRLKQLGQKNPGKWSVCLSCGARLRPAENIPIISWLVQRGKCKHCGAKIGGIELFSELLLGLIFTAMGAFFYPEYVSAFSSGSTWYLPLVIAITLLLIIAMTVMWVLAIYDFMWQELPTRLLTIVNACAIIYTILRFAGILSSGITEQTINSDLWQPLLSMIGGVAILAGTYFLLYFFSKEKLVGSGDWLVALPIALFLGNWWLALVALFVANLLGSIYGIILKVRLSRPAAKQAQPKSSPQIPFGPFLVLAFVIVYSMQTWLLGLITSL